MSQSRRLFSIILFVIICYLLIFIVYAEDDENCSCGYSDDDINIISNIVNGEVGGICGTVTLTYYDGTQLYADACVLHKIHAQIVDNQVNSSMFPDTVYGCAVQCWSNAYAKTGERSSDQWQHCKEDVIEALTDCNRIPNNVFAATCDSKFAQKYNGFYLYARVDWNTGWVSGTFYYYSYGYSYCEDDEEIIEEVTFEKEDNDTYYIEYDYVKNKNNAVEDVKSNIISIIKKLFIIERNKIFFNRWLELE